MRTQNSKATKLDELRAELELALKRVASSEARTEELESALTQAIEQLQLLNFSFEACAIQLTDEQDRTQELKAMNSLLQMRLSSVPNSV